jgi:hypothetical protein
MCFGPFLNPLRLYGTIFLSLKNQENFKMIKIVIASLFLTGCVNLQPGDVSRIMDRIESEIKAFQAAAKPRPANTRPTPPMPEPSRIKAKQDQVMPAPASTANPQ